MKNLKKHAIKIGIAILILGVAYDAVFAGTPSQDPTEDMLVAYNRDTAISATIMALGFAVLIFGIALKILPKNKPNQY